MCLCAFSFTACGKSEKDSSTGGDPVDGKEPVEDTPPDDNPPDDDDEEEEDDSAYEQLPVAGLTFRAVEEGGVTVGYAVSGIDTDEDAKVIIPSEYEGLPVTEVDGYAFYECSNIIYVSIGENVTEIGDSAFYNCEKLEKVVLNGKIENMVSLAFAHCQALKAVKIGKEVKEIGYYAFFECTALEKVTIPSSVKSIGESAFAFCISLEKVNFKEGVEYIGDCAFGGCTALEEFIMPQSVTEIGFGVLMFVGGYLYDGEETFSPNGLKKIVMSDNLTEISQYAFSGTRIESITVGDRVETIDYSAFYLCEWLESVVIPKSVNKIVSYAFYRTSINTVYYEGTAEEWKSISIGRYNDVLSADIYYYSATKPTKTGNFWHYASDGVTPVKW